MVLLNQPSRCFETFPVTIDIPSDFIGLMEEIDKTKKQKKGRKDGFHAQPDMATEIIFLAHQHMLLLLGNRTRARINAKNRKIEKIERK